MHGKGAAKKLLGPMKVFGICPGTWTVVYELIRKTQWTSMEACHFKCRPGPLVAKDMTPEAIEPLTPRLSVGIQKPPSCVSQGYYVAGGSEQLAGSTCKLPRRFSLVGGLSSVVSVAQGLQRH